jgi:hypothetical protein
MPDRVAEGKTPVFPVFPLPVSPVPENCGGPDGVREGDASGGPAFWASAAVSRTNTIAKSVGENANFIMRERSQNLFPNTRFFFNAYAQKPNELCVNPCVDSRERRGEREQRASEGGFAKTRQRAKPTEVGGGSEAGNTD